MIAEWKTSSAGPELAGEAEIAAEITMDLTRQLISFVGALLILIAYAGYQMGWINARRPPYNILNAAGSMILWWIAMHPFQVGFVVLEGVWTVISFWALAKPRPA